MSVFSSHSLEIQDKRMQFRRLYCSALSELASSTATLSLRALLPEVSDVCFNSYLDTISNEYNYRLESEVHPVENQSLT
ncbi:hypothetical protein DPMN_187418 [Dreissena polymorpha]|uniref:Uncharacterized protein n=1 Tax=Dreissena polymorpha TaxID=45954 RepID=A0A9D4DNA8_DREPO|nr:hypothetical protein DPMN_187418 [Dreissena polymorpha]